MTEARSRAEELDAELERGTRRGRQALYGLLTLLVALSVFGSSVGAVGAYEARKAATQAKEQTAANHKTGQQNNQILKEIQATVNRHTSTINGINAIGKAINAIVAAEHIKGVPHFVPVPSSAPLVPVPGESTRTKAHITPKASATPSPKARRSAKPTPRLSSSPTQTAPSGSATPHPLSSIVCVTTICL